MKPRSTPPGEEHRYLLARSGLQDFIDFMLDYATDASELDRTDLARDWNAAHLLMRQLRSSEPDAADGDFVRPLPADHRAAADRVERDAIFRQAFANAKYEIALVNLERVIACQRVVSQKHIQRLSKPLGRQASFDQLFQFCLPVGRPLPEFEASRITDDEFAFISGSNDLRFQQAVLLRPDQVQGLQPDGPIAGILALVVGFGSNFLNLMQANDRLVLNNGYHRACTLYSLGYRWVPAVVQTILRPDEFESEMPSAVRKSPDFYLSEPRPPLVKDYFHSVLSRSVYMSLSRKQVRIEYSVEELDIP